MSKFVLLTTNTGVAPWSNDDSGKGAARNIGPFDNEGDAHAYGSTRFGWFLIKELELPAAR
jgi:hypothetical protein